MDYSNYLDKRRIALFTYALSVMLKNNESLIYSLESTKEILLDSNDSHYKIMLENYNQLIENINKGKSFQESLEQSKLFDNFFVYTTNYNKNNSLHETLYLLHEYYISK